MEASSGFRDVFVLICWLLINALVAAGQQLMVVGKPIDRGWQTNRRLLAKPLDHAYHTEGCICSLFFRFLGELVLPATCNVLELQPFICLVFAVFWSLDLRGIAHNLGFRPLICLVFTAFWTLDPSFAWYLRTFLEVRCFLGVRQVHLHGSTKISEFRLGLCNIFGLLRKE